MAQLIYYCDKGLATFFEEIQSDDI